MQDWIKKENIPTGTNIKFLGQAEENTEAGQFAIAAFISILLMMGVILLLQFNSFYHVFLTLSAVIMSVIGVMAGLTFYSYISMILVLTGVIALAGIVVNNNIVLIDTYQRLKATGFSSEEAAIRTAAQRLRPVVLTTTTTIIGLMPLVLGWRANIFTGEFSTLGSSRFGYMGSNILCFIYRARLCYNFNTYYYTSYVGNAVCFKKTNTKFSVKQFFQKEKNYSVTSIAVFRILNFLLGAKDHSMLNAPT